MSELKIKKSKKWLIFRILGKGVNKQISYFGGRGFLTSFF
jgi:hypothetical protein